jgi:poly(A) polymerase
MSKIKHLDREKLLKQIGDMGDGDGLQVYVVGGYVRDQILEKEIHEIDFTVLGDGPEFARKAMKAVGGNGFVVYPKFGTASFLINGLKMEFVSARKEEYMEDSRNPTVIQGDLSVDLARRDFTINTLALGLNSENFGDLVNPYNGLSDLKTKCIRTPLEPGTTFSDDPLRIMRAARFAGQLHFTIEPKTLKAMTDMRDRLQIVSQERITDEFLKILSHPQPSVGLKILQNAGVLAVFFPELDALTGVEQRDDFHHKDVFDHTMKVVDNLAFMSDNKFLRFTALVHDIGKPKVKRFIKSTGWTFHGHEQVGVHMLKNVCRRLKLSNDFLRYSQKLTHLHMRPIHLINEEVTDSAIRRLLFQAGDEINDLMTLCRADITSGNPKRVKQHLINFDRVAEKMKVVEEKDRMRAFQSPVRGEEIMEICGIDPGPWVGILKKMIEEAILDGMIPNEHDPALKYLLEIKDEVLKNKNHRN